MSAPQFRTAVSSSLQAVRRTVRAIGAVLSRGRGLAIGALVVLAAVRVEDPTVLQALRHQTLDLIQASTPRELATDRVLIVDVDEESIQALGQWPWSRARIAQIVDALSRSGAAAIGFDIVFSEPDRLSPPTFAEGADGVPDFLRGALSGLPDTDAQLAAAIAVAPVVLGASASEDVALAEDASRLRGSAGTLIAYRGDPAPHIFGARAMLRNIDVLEDAAPGRGLFTLAPEHDGVVRRVPMVLRVGDVVLPSLTLEMLRVAAGVGQYATLLNAAGTGVEAVRVGPYTIPTDRHGRAWLHFASHRPDLYISAVDLLSGAIPPERIDGRFVLIGASAVGLRDLRLTALGETVPGVEVHAQVLDAALSDDHLRRPTYAMGLEHAIAVVCGLLLIVAAPRLSAVGGGVFAVGLLGLVWFGVVYAFADRSLMFDPTYPSLAVVVCYAALAYSAFSRAEAQRRQIRTAFSQYLSPDLVTRLAEDPESLQLGGELREMTFFFSDLAGFTTFAEQCAPEELVALLNEYLDGVCKIVMAHGGTIDKIVGDAVHAMFNAPLDDPDHAENAVRCALAVEAFAKEYEARRRAEGRMFGGTRIGVNTGSAVVGNFGGARRFDYTAHGDAINTAARLEGANKHLGTTICVAGSTVERCRDLAFRPIGALVLKGKNAAVPTFDPERIEPIARAPRDRYLNAFDLLSTGSDAVRSTFETLSDAYPDDPLVALHLGRLRAGAAGSEIRMSEK